jgi:hypothetical protein
MSPSCERRPRLETDALKWQRAAADPRSVSPSQSDLEPRTAPQPVTAPEPLTAEEWTRRHSRVVVPVAGGVVAGIVKLVGIHALLHPGAIIVAVAIVVFATGVLIVTRRPQRP